MSTSQAIRERIAAQPAGEPFTPALFAGLGSRASIDQTLMRLTKEGFIERLGRGLYTVPKTSRFGLKSMPSPEAVAQTVAAAEGASIEVHGAEAARRFGFSTQVPIPIIGDRPRFIWVLILARVQANSCGIHSQNSIPSS